MTTKCNEVIVQLVVRTYDDAGDPVGEKTTNAVTIFRNSETADLWAAIDRTVERLEAKS